MSSDWDQIRTRLADAAKQDEVERAWREHRAQREWISLNDLGKPRPQQDKREYLH